ncbi:MAG: VCBS repeat-containing protein [Alphaproteobacteria bacterium]|nr:VCBS repeat-containing protein [Alphaproteobacteria bacterium]
MRVAGTVLLLSIGVMALVACNPPNPENEAPNIQLLDPVGTYTPSTGLTTYEAAANVPFDMTFRLRDRDGDSPLSIKLYLDPTPDDPDDVEADILLDEADGLIPVETEIPEIPAEPDGKQIKVDLVDVVLQVPDGLDEGTQTVVAVADDAKAIDNLRRVSYSFVVNASISAPEVSINPANPTAQDALSGLLVTESVDPEGGTPFHAWRWHRVDPADPEVTLPPNGEYGINFPGPLPAVNTARGETWEFCVTAFESPDGTPPDDPEEAQQRTTCAEVLIENAAPGAPGAVEILPERATAVDPLFCDVVIDASDPDGDAVTYEYAWAVGGTTVISGSATPWLDPAEMAGGDSWTCTATSVDTSEGTPLTGGQLTSAATVVAAASLSAPTRASRTISGGTDAHAGEYVGIAPIETFTAGFAQECLLVGTPTGVGGQGSVDVFRGSALQAANPNLSLAGGSATGLGGPLAVGDVEADGNPEAVVGSDGAVWVLYSDSLAASTVDYDLTAGTTTAVAITSTDTGFGNAISVGEIFPLSPNLEVVIATNDPVAQNTVRIIDGDLLDRADADIDLDVSSPASTITGDSSGDLFGAAVLAAPDLTGDGLADLVVSDPSGAANAVFVFPGGSGLSGSIDTSSAAFVVTGTTGQVGTSLAAGDLDGDGAADLIVGGPGRGVGGEVAVFLNATVAGGGSVAFGSADYVIRGNTGTGFGTDIAVIADPSGMFGDTLVVGAPLEDDGSVTGAGFVYLFTPDSLASAPTPQAITVAASAVSYHGDGQDGHLTVRSNASDLDNDGFPDLVLSAPDYGVGTFNGRVYVLFSSSL